MANVDYIACIVIGGICAVISYYFGFDFQFFKEKNKEKSIKNDESIQKIEKPKPKMLIDLFKLDFSNWFHLFNKSTNNITNNNFLNQTEEINHIKALQTQCKK